MASSDIGAFAAAFGDAFSRTHNANIQRQLAVKAQKDLEIADVLVKSVFDDPSLADDPDVQKFMSAKLGKANAQGIAQVAAAFNNSPMGILRRSFGADVDVPQGVSMGADGPGTGPTMAPKDILATGSTQQKEQLRDTIRARMAGKSALETGLGYGQGQGQLRAQDMKTTAADQPKPMTEYQREMVGIDREKLALQREKVAKSSTLTPYQTEVLNLRRQEMAWKKENKGQLTPYQKEQIRLREQGLEQSKTNADREYELKAKGEAGRAGFRNWLTTKGERFEELVTLPTGDQIPVTKRRFSTDGGQTIQEQIISEKRKSPPVGAIEKVTALNSALRLEDELEQMFTANKDKLGQIFAPFAGRTLADLQNTLGALDPVQQAFVRKLADLRLQRVIVNGGKAITGTELEIIDTTLPNVNVLIESFPGMLQTSRETLTALGADTENALNSTGYLAPPIYRSKSNLDYYNHIRKKLPKLDTNPVTVWAAPDAEAEGPTSSGDPEADALNAVFMGQGQ